MKTILITGGLGYIGSHTAIEILLSGYEVIIIDNLSNSSIKVIDRIEKVAGKSILAFYLSDVCDNEALEIIFERHSKDLIAVIHFAGLKSVSQSVENPLEYYENNLLSTIRLLKIMKKYQVNNFIFSSSATVYGQIQDIPAGGITEDMPTNAINPYGRTKLFIEEILKDFCYTNKDFHIAVLRYFNPVGSHHSSLIGESPKGIPNNLMPYITQVLIGQRSHLNIFGHDYQTFDGTAIRDYIHVVDLAQAHIASLQYILKIQPSFSIHNIGTGKGYSVLEVIKAMEKATDRQVVYQFTERRAGDMAVCYANVDKAKKELGWSAKFDLDQMCADAWRWQVNNPNCYE